MKLYVRFIILCAFITLAVFSFGCDGSDESLYTVRVMISDTENLTVLGENPVTVRAGEAASFPVSIPEGMTICDITSGAYYENGEIKLDEVRFPATVNATVRQRYTYKYRVSAAAGGTVLSDSDWHDKTEGDAITVSAKPKRGYVFAGWSRDNKYSDGGTIVAHDSTYQFNITDNTDLYANFIKESATLIRYNANGGIVTSGGETYIDIVEDDYHFYANSLPDMGYFEREGYILYGYNTQADGSGEYFGLGWNIVSNERTVDLYCMWAKESNAADFVYKIESNTVKITEYKGNDEIIVVPYRMNGRKTGIIGEGTFDGCAAKTVILPSALKKIEDGAFKNCAFSSLYIADNVTKVSDEAFVDCDDFTTLYINAARKTTFQTNGHGTYAIKYERLMYAYRNGLKKLAFTSGSNGTYGIYSEQLEAGLDNEYYIIDYSCHFESCGMFFIDLISDFLCQDDIIMFMPEPNAYQLGSNAWTPVMWQFLEGAFGSVTHINIKDYDDIFDTFAIFNDSRTKMSPTEYTDYWDGIDRYGDNDWFRGGESVNFIGSQGTYDLGTDYINCDNLNLAFDRCAERGARIYFSFASLNRNALVGKGKDDTHRQAYEQFMRDKLHVTVISDVDRYIFSGKYMSGTNFHLSSEGTVLRTKYIISDIRAQLAEDYLDTWGKK